MSEATVQIIYTEDAYYNETEKDGTPIPMKLVYAHEGDSGFDLRASTDVTIPGHRCGIVGTGIKMAIPVGLEVQVRTRSGSPLKRGFFVANSPGTVDAGYRGEIGVIVQNLRDEDLIIEAGERVAQGVLCPIIKAKFQIVDSLDSTARGTGAYNSTGTK